MGEQQLNLFGFEDGSRDIKKRNKVILPIDTLILLIVVVVLLGVLTFSLGVEKGRKIASSKTDYEDKFELEAANVDRDSLSIKSDYQQSVTELLPDKNEEKIIKEEKENNLINKEKVEKEPIPQEKGYIVQLATYLKDVIALEEAKKLKENGYPVSVSKRGDFTVVFVGEFKDREAAQKNMQALRKRYKDCFIRRLK